jgi:dinuclear metal center YbgI/SA1388 family protein
MGLPIAQVLRLLGERAPLALAESWDNVGLLIEPSASTGEVSRALLTIDLDLDVLEEASAAGVELIVAYHPPIFGGLKRLRASEPAERVVVEAIRRGLFVYSPHTALDATAGGMTDWLARALGPGTMRAIVPSVLAPVNAGDAPTGAGRIVRLEQPLRLDTALLAIKAHLGLARVRVAEAERHRAGSDLVETFAVCPGAGGSVFEKLGEVDLLLTGEMRHHDIAARARRGTSVVVCDHTNTERGYLPVFAAELRQLLEGVEVLVSERDREPLRIV